MLESMLMQVTSGIQQPSSASSSSDGLAVLIGLLATALPTISLVLRNYYNGQLKHKGEEVIKASRKVVDQEKVINDFTPLLTKLIIANNDGRITQEEYNIIVREAESKLVLYSKETGIDLVGLITSLRMLMEKSSPVEVDTNGKGMIVALEKEASLGRRGAAHASAVLKVKNPKTIATEDYGAAES